MHILPVIFPPSLSGRLLSGSGSLSHRKGPSAQRTGNEDVVFGLSSSSGDDGIKRRVYICLSVSLGKVLRQEGSIFLITSHPAWQIIRDEWVYKQLQCPNSLLTFDLLILLTSLPEANTDKVIFVFLKCYSAHSEWTFCVKKALNTNAQETFESFHLKITSC